MSQPPTWSTMFAGMSGSELLSRVEAETHAGCTVRDTSGDPTHLALIRSHLAPLVRELARRTDRHAAGTGPDPRAGWIVDLAGVARDLRRVADMRYALDLNGWDPVRTSSRGELAGRCAFCGGHDRFLVWPASADRDGRAWCRRCGWSGDAVRLYQDLENVGFVRAVEDLAGRFGVPLPRVGETDALITLGNARRVLAVAP